jgi:CrcB protein
MKIGQILLIGLGGFIGTILRYLSSTFLDKFQPIKLLPISTLYINIIGCFIIGLLYGVSEKNNFFSHNIKLFLTIGICGGYTTFSAFAIENVEMLEQSNYIGFVFYTLISLLVCISSVIMGLYIIRLI